MLIYNDETLFGTNENGEAIVFDWAHECGFHPQIGSRRFVRLSSALGS